MRIFILWKEILEIEQMYAVRDLRDDPDKTIHPLFFPKTISVHFPFSQRITTNEQDEIISARCLTLLHRQNNDGLTRSQVAS